MAQQWEKPLDLQQLQSTDTSCEMQMCIAALVTSTGHDCVSCSLLCSSCHLFTCIFFLPLSLLCDVVCDTGALFKEDAVPQGWAENCQLNSCRTEQLSLQPAWTQWRC